MISNHLQFMILAGALLCAPLQVHAQTPTSELSAATQQSLSRVEAYLNDITTLQSPFLQIASNGETAEGTIYLSRPNRLRIEYTPPTPILIVANSEFLSYVDTELEQIHHIALEDTPAAFLLKDDFSLTGGDLTVTGYDEAANTIRVSVVKASDPLAGELTMVLTDNPMILRKWSVTDAQGVVTTITLINPRFGLPIDEDRIERLPRFEDNQN